MKEFISPRAGDSDESIEFITGLLGLFGLWIFGVM